MYNAPSGPNLKSLGKRKGSPSQAVRIVSTEPSKVTFRREGGLRDSATQRAPVRSSVIPFGRPVLATTFRVLPSLPSLRIHPLSRCISVRTHVPSGRITGASGFLRSVARIMIHLPRLVADRL